jgi:transcription elongation factor Elf1
MDVEEFRTKPSWEAYEATLRSRGSMPRFEPGEAPLPNTCCRCGTTSVYVVLTDGTTTLGFVVCSPCGEWIGRAITGQTTGA